MVRLSESNVELTLVVLKHRRDTQRTAECRRVEPMETEQVRRIIQVRMGRAGRSEPDVPEKSIFSICLFPFFICRGGRGQYRFAVASGAVSLGSTRCAFRLNPRYR